MAYIDALNQAVRGNSLDALATFPGRPHSKSGNSSASYVVSAAQRLSQLRQHGSFTLAYSAAFQDNLEYFGNPTADTSPIGWSAPRRSRSPIPSPLRRIAKHSFATSSRPSPTCASARYRGRRPNSSSVPGSA